MAFKYNSSIRARAIEETLEHARALARTLGITRVTDTTRLDRAGVPVFASIRPGAQVGSLCVNAGKGLTAAEAQIGAYMESIEIACAEPVRAAVTVIQATGREIAERGYPLVDFLPRSDVEVRDDVPIPCVEAEELTSGRRCLVPAERVLFPYPSTYFTSDTNGLASGNTVLEATVHGLAEVIERDISSFALLNRWRRIRTATLPGPLAEIAERIRPSGLDLLVRVLDNEYDLPFFNSIVREPTVVDAVHLGYGCHAWSGIAATRAVTECFQERLTIIHGGRDSLLRLQDISIKEPERRGMKDAFADALVRDEEQVDYAEVVDWSAATPTLEALYELLAARVVPVSGGVLRVCLTPPELPIQVVKVIVPRMEFYVAERLHAGERLRAAQRASASLKARSNASA